VIRVRAAGDAALLLETDLTGGSGDDDGNGPALLAAAIRARGLPGVIDVVPGAATVLVSFEPGSWASGDLASELERLPLLPDQDRLSARRTELDVVYDGPDLADVAALTGLTVSEVIARHQAAEYRVGWLGFSPGFGYLTGLDPLLAAVPRLASPRLSVPAGSVAIAGGLAGVYPAASPGGWRLLGRTTATLWDQDRDPPALLAAGTRVRFRAVDRLPAPAEPQAAAAVAVPGQRRIQVLEPGPLTTVQDLGRPGLAHLGVPRSGAADADGLRLANELAGNAAGAACLEITFGRLVLRFDCDAIAALAGAAAPVRLTTAAGQESQLMPDAAFTVSAGSVLRVGAPSRGLRSYLAIRGGIGVVPVLGSRSADRLSGLGPGPLRPGEWLPLERPRSRPEQETQGRPRNYGSRLPAAAAEIELRAIAGPRDDWFGESAPGVLAGGSYLVSAASNRTGLRLTGPRLRRDRAAELPSEGLAVGSLQVTHDGQPILLLADHPTTGGYPVIAVVVTADIGLAAQLRPSQRVRFRLIRS
jgi:KipI family sensor histidine kinase inhibitor